MSVYKVSYDLLKQQSEALTKVATKINTHGDDLMSVSNSLAVNTAFGDFRNDIKKLSSYLEEFSTVINACGLVLGAIQEAYQNQETTHVKRAQETKVYKRDFYKQPVVIIVQDTGSDAPISSSGGGASYANTSSGGGYSADTGSSGGYSGSTSSGSTSSTTASDVGERISGLNNTSGSTTTGGTTAGNTSFGGSGTGGTTPTGGFEAPSGGNTTGASQPDINITNIYVESPEMSTPDVSGGGISAGAAAGIGAGAAAVGAGAAFAASKIKNKIKANKNANDEEFVETTPEVEYQAPQNNSDFIDPEEALRIARQKLAELEESP